MVQVTWSAPALDDLYEIHDYISRGSPQNARQVVLRIQEVASRLADSPLLGRIVPEIAGGGYREVFESGYRIIYRFQREQEQVIIAAVYRGRRTLPAGRIP